MSSGASRYLEVEVKFYVEELSPLRERLLAEGAKQVKPRLFERNVRYDNPQAELRRNLQLLRLRQDDVARLTFKSAAREDETSQAKVRRELEVEVSDFGTTAAILSQLGFEEQQVYEKYRETFLFEDVEIVLDELPYGNFVELEGAEEQLRDCAGRLGLKWERRIVDNYLLLMARLKEHHRLPFDDLTFDNFKGLGVSIRDVLGPDQTAPE